MYELPVEAHTSSPRGGDQFFHISIRERSRHSYTTLHICAVLGPPGVQYENALLQIAPVDKAKCPYVKHAADISFQLYTRHNPTAYQELAPGDDERLFASNLDWGAKTLIYFHAFMEQPDDGSGIMVREALMQRGDTNVIMVEAARLEAGPWYFTAAQNTWYIGRYAAAFIDYLVSRGLQLNNTMLVGHSLGAQAAGVAGSALTSGRVSRITGLDPALPLFSGLPLAQRLDPSDAEFVDVIHTDAGIFGYKEAIGHADFFPNGGKSPQPGCELEVVIPQQLLLNKCDGTERTRGFYTYYLTSSALPPHHSGEHTAHHQIEPVQTDDTKLSHSKRMTEHTYKKKKSKIHTDVNTRHAHSETNLRRKRVKRNTTDTHTDVKLDTELVKNNTRNDAHIETLTTLNDTLSDKEQKPTHEKKTHTQAKKSTISQNNRHAKKRQKRFLQLFRADNKEESFIFRALDFLVKNRRSVVPIVSVVRDVSTLVRSQGGELNHVTREKGNYLGLTPPDLPPVSYTLELGNENRALAFIKRLLGFTPKGDRLTVGGG
uniref:Lipase domain-containing protein n=1 Tax=Heliothis virescens TaxID=7102 RepID=A0A2A4J568_HELVI